MFRVPFSICKGPFWIGYVFRKSNLFLTIQKMVERGPWDLQIHLEIGKNGTNDSYEAFQNTKCEAKIGSDANA